MPSIIAGAKMSNIPAEEVFIPCHNGISCFTFDISQHKGNLSVIAGHFSLDDLEAAGVRDYDCLFNVREPIDRSISCLLFFYGETFKHSHGWSAEEFKHKVTHEAVEKARCYNDATGMLATLPGEAAKTALKSSRSNETSEILDAALASLRRCVIVDLVDISHGENWGNEASRVLSAWFPWLGKDIVIPIENISQESGRREKLPHRLIQVLEDLNDLDMVIYREALYLMRLQKKALQGGSLVSTHN